MSLLWIALVFIAGVILGATIAFILAARSYDRGYSDALKEAGASESSQPVSPRKASASPHSEH